MAVVKTKSGPDSRLFEHFGVDLPSETNGSGELVCSCPFCEKEDHFFINHDTTQYSCKICGEQGNAYSFMQAVYEQAVLETNAHSYTRLSAKRKKLHKDAFVQAHIAWSDILEAWLLPVLSTSGAMTNLLLYGGDGPWIGAPGCSQHIYGLETIQPEGPIFVCEGQWDTITLRWLLRRTKEFKQPWSVVGVPGASTFPKADLEPFSGREVYLLYDNDEAGKKGMKSAIVKLNSVGATPYVLAWPEGTPEKMDIDDYCRESPDRPDTTLNNILSNCFKVQHGVSIDDPQEILIRNSINELYQDYRDTGIHMYPGLKDCLALTLAVLYSTKFQGEPLWLYVIGDPGRGKSLVLESTLGSRSAIYRTSITHKAFVSGFRQEGEDRSLLSLLPGKTLVVKDYSNVLSLPYQEQDQLVSLLREAYDGRIVRSYGNNVYREYPPADSPFKDCRFSLVAGVTKEIHARSHAGLGERFLKFEIPCTDNDNLQAMLSALGDNWSTHEQAAHRAAAVGAFLDRPINFDRLDSLTDSYKERIIALSSFVGLCRSPVSRTKGDLDFVPSPESGTRVAKQLLKLSQALCFVFNKRGCDQDVYRLVRKVAWDTAHGWRRDLFIHLFESDTHRGTTAIASSTGLSLGTTHRQLHDMLALDIVEKRVEDKQLYWALSSKSRELIHTGELD